MYEDQQQRWIHFLQKLPQLKQGPVYHQDRCDSLTCSCAFLAICALVFANQLLHFGNCATQVVMQLSY